MPGRIQRSGAGARGARGVLPRSAGVRAAPYPPARLAPSGLQLRPHPGSDLAAVARFALEHEPSLPNQRLVIETYHWPTPLTLALRTTLQGLADAAAVSICVKSRDDTWEL